MVSGNGHLGPPPSPARSASPVGAGQEHAPAGALAQKAGATATARVILVGATGLETGLRHDDTIELIRARTPFEAIGELSDPIDESSPSVTTVIVSRFADPSMIAPLSPKAGPGARASDFVQSLRQIDPGVRVLLMGDGDAGSQAENAAYDGVIPEAAPATMVRRLVRAGLSAAVVGTKNAASPVLAPAPMQVQATAPTDGQPAPERVDVNEIAAEVVPPSPPSSPVSAVEQALPATGVRPSAWSASQMAPARRESVAAGGEVGVGETGGISAIEALLTGGDAVAAAVAEIRTRLGLAADELVFLHVGDQAEASLSGGNTFAVTHRGRHFGSLAVVRDDEAVDASAMLHAAAWLGSVMALRHQQDMLREAAFSDELTGAYNRRYFKRFAQAAIDQARGTRRTVTLLLFDVDDFKTYNDAHGHDAGDEILVEVVRLLNSVIRPTDRVCRIGGDEFVVVFNEPAGPRVEGSRPPQTVWEIAQRFQKQVAEHRFPKLAACAAGKLSVSGGLATFPWDGQSVDELLCRADQLAIASKRQGKNAIKLGPGAERSCK